MISCNCLTAFAQTFPIPNTEQKMAESFSLSRICLAGVKFR